MNGQEVNTLSDIIVNIVTSLAIIIGGVWGYWTFVIKRQNVWNLQITLEPEIIPYSHSKRLLVIYVILRNVGQVKVTPGPKGCQLTIWKMQSDKKEGELVLPKEGEKLIEKLDILRKYKEKGSYWHYEIEPNCQYQEMESIVVNKGVLLAIEAKFFPPEEGDYINETKVIRVT